MRNLRIIFKYIKFWFTAKTKFSVHSPFVYTFITEVLKNKGKFYAYDEVENIRGKLLDDCKTITVNDLGAGSTVMKSDQRRICDIAKYSAKSPRLAQLLHRMASFYRPVNCIELGTSLGISTSYLALADKTRTVHTIEGSEEILNLAILNFEKLNVTNVKTYQGNFIDHLPQILSKQIPGLVFVDGNHTKKATLLYFEMIVKKADNDTIIVFDDIHWSDEMEEAWEIIKQHPQVKVTVDIFFMGIVFLRKELQKEDFRIRF